MRIIEGRNPVLEAMKAGQPVKKLIMQDGGKGKIIDDLISTAKNLRIPVETTSKVELTKLTESETHQGVIAYADEYRYAEIEEIIAGAKEKGEAPFVIILDEIQDPHNLGSIIRTANAAGVHGIVIPKHRAAEITAVVSKTSSGAVEYMRVAQVTNIVRAIEELKELGLWICGSAMDADQSIYQANLKGPLGVVVGSEGEGIRRLVKEKCDFLVNIPMYGQINSLNASVATAVLIYEAVRQRRLL